MNKKLIIPIIASITIIGVVVGVTYAFFSANVVENNKTETVIKTNELNITYTGGTEITASNMIPGDSFTKTFSVENTSNTPVDYNIYMESITNEFNEDLVYTLTDDNGEVIEETVLPSTGGKEYIKTAIKINASETKNYTLKVEYKYLDTPQNNYQGKIFNATLGIDTNQIDNVVLINNKIIIDNIEVGKSKNSIFKLVNNSSLTRDYEIKLTDVVNTFSNNLTYRVLKEDEVVVSERELPTEDTTLLSGKIKGNETLIFNFEITNNLLSLDISNFQLLANEIFNATIIIETNESICEYESGDEWQFDYNGKEKIFEVPCNGSYEIETWGAQGGNANSTYIGGYGAYSKGNVILEKNSNLYINIGGQGSSGSNKLIVGGYNGGGNAKTLNGIDIAASGGGATHVSKKTGLLNTLESDLDSVVIISSGGGGGYYYSSYNSVGAHGGGIKGNIAPAGRCSDRKYLYGSAATQTMPGAGGGCMNTLISSNSSFGQGGSGDWCSGGGGGFYGGGYGYAHGAQGGSSYIGNSNLTNKHMTCYNCETSDEESTKTISNTCASNDPKEDCSKIGNGFARITYLGK